MREMHTYHQLTQQLERLRVSLLLQQTPADADHSDRDVLLPDALRQSLEHLRLWEIAGLAEQILAQGKVKQLHRLCRVLVETLVSEASPFCLHLLALLCQAGNGSAAFDKHQREAWIATGRKELILLAWICDLPARKLLAEIPKEKIYSSLHYQLNPDDVPEPFGVMAHFHLLAGILQVMQNQPQLATRLREMPLTHTLLSQFYQYEAQWLPHLPELLEFCRRLPKHPRLFLVYAPIQTLLVEYFDLQKRQGEVRREWEKTSKRKKEDAAGELVYHWIANKQEALALRLSSLRAWICLDSPPLTRELPFKPVKALESAKYGIPAHVFLEPEQQWGPLSSQAKDRRALMQVCHQWQERLFSRFNMRAVLPEKRYTSLFIEDGEFSWLFLVWALSHWPDLQKPFQPEIDWVSADFPSHETAQGVLRHLRFNQPQELLAFAELLPNGERPSARFIALCDFIVREMYFKDENQQPLKTNSLLSKGLRPLIRESTGLIDTPKRKISAQNRLDKLMRDLHKALQSPSLQTEIKKLKAQGYFEWVLSELLLRAGDPAPRVFFLHSLISRRALGNGNLPVVLLSGQMIPTPESRYWPFVARRCATLLWPVVNRLNFALTDALFMEQIEKDRQHRLLIADEHRQSKQYAKVTQQLDSVFQLERQLNNLLENIRQSVLPPALALFSMGQWAAFSQLFDDRKILKLQDGTAFRGFHSTQNVTPADFKLWMRWLQESLLPEEPQGFLKALIQTWETGEPTAQNAQLMSALLKLICYDSLDRQKPVYWSQILAALRAPGQEQERLYLSGQRREDAQETDLTPLLNQAESPFLLWLAHEISPQVLQYRDPADSPLRFQLSGETSAAEFLQSLAYLVHHALRPRPGGREQVFLEEVQLWLETHQETAVSLTLILNCQGLFENPEILTHNESPHYHSTREHFQVLARALNGLEKFSLRNHLSPKDLGKTLANPPAPLLILPSKPENRTRIVLYLKGEQSWPQSPPAPFFGDMEA